MKHCPNCHYEYEDWATTCSDCEVALEAGPPPVAEAPPVIDYGQFSDWVIVTNVPNTMMGTLVKDQLQQAGIPVLMKRSHATDVAEWTHNDFAWQDLYVPRRFLVRARRLVDSPPGRRYAGGDVVEDIWDGADDDGSEEELAAGDVLGIPPTNLQSGWYLIDSARPAAPSDTPTLVQPARPVPLPSLSRYRTEIARRKDHQAPPPGEPRVVPFPGAPVPDQGTYHSPPDQGGSGYAPQGYMDNERDDDYAPRSGASAWTHSRIYRILLGLMFLAWTLPFLLQMLQYFRDAFGRLLP